MIIGKSSKCNFIQEISNSRKKKILSYLTKKDREKNINTYIQKEKQKGKERKERKKERKNNGSWVTEKDRKRQRTEEKKAIVKTRKKDGKRERIKRKKTQTKTEWLTMQGWNESKNENMA